MGDACIDVRAFMCTCILHPLEEGPHAGRQGQCNDLLKVIRQSPPPDFLYLGNSHPIPLSVSEVADSDFKIHSKNFATPGRLRSFCGIQTHTESEQSTLSRA